MNKKTLHDIDVAGKHVLVRVDYNVPLDEDLHIIDETRIQATLPTLHYLPDQGAAVILLSHLGRPGGMVVEALRMAPVAQRLSELLDLPVQTVPDCIGAEVASRARALQPGQVLFLENVRFHKEETLNDPAFARQLAALAEIYVNDAFGAAHRAHASTEGITHYLPAVGGLLMEKELFFLGAVLEHPKHPFAAIIGGAKVSDKLALLNHLSSTVDMLLIGGGMANTFLKAMGYEVGESLAENSQIRVAREVLARARQRRITFLVPVDAVISRCIEGHDIVRTVPIDEVPAEWRILDIGPQTIAIFQQALANARLLLWNGTLGMAEKPPFARGTQAMIHVLSRYTQSGATTIIGGGDTVSAVVQAGATQNMTHISTGGGATLKFLAEQPLPGVEALQEKVYSSMTNGIAHR